MKPIPLILIVICLFIFRFTCSAQNIPDDGWLRVQTDNGEFSIEFPAEHAYFFDDGGFIAAESQNDYLVREMKLLNAYRDETLLSVETYRADANAMKALLSATLDRGMHKKKIRINGVEVRELTKTEDNPATGDKFYFVSRYFRSKDFVYVISGLSREGETPTMKRFFESLRFDPRAGSPLVGTAQLVELKSSPVDIKDFVPSQAANTIADKTPGAPSALDPSYVKVIVASKPRASYVKSARDLNVKGAVRLKLVLSEKGFIPSIQVVTALPEGLTRQAIFAALRLKFLPAKNGGMTIPVRKTLEYTFDIY
jgi:hypothetical protein